MGITLRTNDGFLRRLITGEKIVKWYVSLRHVGS